MKLSEAIIVGAAKTKPFSSILSNGTDATCALGAAGLAIGLDMVEMSDPNTSEKCYDALKLAFPILNKINPESGRQYMRDIWSMNDSDNMTRGEIAEYVKKFEEAEENN